MRPSTPKRRLERLERKVLSHLDGWERATFLLRRLHAKGPLTEAGVSWLAVMTPLDARERAHYIDCIRQAAAQDGIDTPWSEEEAMHEAAKRLLVNWHITDRKCDGPMLVSCDAEEAYQDYQEWQAHPPYGEEPRPLISRETYSRLFKEQRPLYLKSALRQPA